jgi:alpha-glucan,water dikinase
VWASKWNERAYFSTRKAKIDHSDLCMAVLVQEIIQADYAFVIHTTNPSTEDETEIYAEVKLKAFVKNGRSTLNIVY